VHRYKGDKQPVNLINSASNEMVAKGARDDYYAELLKLFLVEKLLELNHYKHF
jgi:hypothetical protein